MDVISRRFLRLCTRLSAVLPLRRLLHTGNVSSTFPEPKRTTNNSVGIFWDLDNKPPISVPPYDAAIRLKIAASEFGVVRYMVAYANRHAFTYVPPDVRLQRRERKALDRAESRGLTTPAVPYVCRVCGRKFHTNVKLVNHFKELHEREQIKRMNRLNSAKGKRRIELAGKMAMKIEKYKAAARDILTPKVGCGLAGEIKRAGFWVRTVPDKPQAADIALRDHISETIERGLKCLVLVSDDSDFVDVLKEARYKSLKTVVVGDKNDGALKRCADTSFSWQDIASGKAKKEAVSTASRWNDREILKKLEWTYVPEVEISDSDTFELERDTECENVCIHTDKGLEGNENSSPWWKLDSDSDDTIPK
ncbi:unnamed protein product [Victoria cruziana]